MIVIVLSIVLLALACASVSAGDAEDADDSICWHDARALTVEGRGWTDTAEFYNRLPAKAESAVPKSVWDLSKHSAGMVVRFVTDSTEVRVRWTLINETLAMNHMPATGVSGVDLYVRRNGAWQWLAIGRPSAKENEASLVEGLKPEAREYALYLPLYNGVSSVMVGVSKGSAVEPAPSRKRNIRPLVFYGSSILQGGCASRPGMAYPSIIGRRLDIPTINLGFSGAGKCEPEVAELLAELDPQLYVIDCMPNMSPDIVDDRIRYLLSLLRRKHPSTPVILVEQAPSQSAFTRYSETQPAVLKNRRLEAVFNDLADEWNGLLRYVKGDRLFGGDGEATVDGVHATDLGFQRMAEVLMPAVEDALACAN